MPLTAADSAPPLRAPSPPPALLPWLLLAALARAITALPDQVSFPVNDDTFKTTENDSLLHPANASLQEISGNNFTSVLSTRLEPTQMEGSPGMALEAPASVSSAAVDAHRFPSPPHGKASPPPVVDHNAPADGAAEMPGATAQIYNSAHINDGHQAYLFGSSGDGLPTEIPQRFKIVKTMNPVTSEIENSKFVHAFEQDDLVVQELQSSEKMENSELRRSSRESNDVYTVKTEVITATSVLLKDTTNSGLLTDATTIAVPPMPTKQETTKHIVEPGFATQGTETFENLDDTELKTSSIMVQSVEGFDHYSEGTLTAGVPFITNTEVKDALQSTASTVTFMEDPWLNVTEKDDLHITEAPSSEGEVWSEGWKGDDRVNVNDNEASSFGGNNNTNESATQSKTQLEAPNAGNSSETYANFGTAGEIYDTSDRKGTPTLQLEDSSKDSDSNWSQQSTADPELEDSMESWFVTTVTDMQPRTPEVEELASRITTAPAENNNGYGYKNNVTFIDGSLSAEPTSQISTSSDLVDTGRPWDRVKSKGKTAVDAAGSFELVGGVRRCRPGYVQHNTSCVSVCASTPHYCYNNGRCYLVENLGAICRCSAQEYSWYKGAQCQSVVTDFQVGCVAVGTALLVLFLIFMLIVFFAKRLHSLSTENQQLRAKSLPKCQLEAGADNFSLSTVAVESCIPPPPRKSCQESPSLLPSARALNYYDNMLCTDDPNQKQEKNGESGAVVVGHGKPLNAGASAPYPPHVPHAKPENTCDEKATESHSFQNNLA